VNRTSWTSWTRTTLGAATTSALLLSLTACGGGTKSVSQAEVEKQVSTQLTKQVGQKPDSISCPDDLPAEKGSTMRCTLEAGGTSIGLTVTVTSVEDSNVKFDIQVDDKVAGS
jgi:hypothetical protein